jgi:hypothetical protein
LIAIGPAALGFERLDPVKSISHQSGYPMLLSAAEWPVASASPLRTIIERDLLDNIRSGALRRLTIVQTEARMYRLRVSLIVERHDFVLATARGLPRQWSSLDCLARRIQCKYGSPAVVTLSLGNGSTLPIERSGAVEEGPEFISPNATRLVRSQQVLAQ